IGGGVGLDAAMAEQVHEAVATDGLVVDDEDAGRRDRRHRVTSAITSAGGAIGGAAGTGARAAPRARWGGTAGARVAGSCSSPPASGMVRRTRVPWPGRLVMVKR